MISTWSTVCATSARTWLETSTVRLPAAKSRRKSRSQRTPSGSRPFAGSSRTRSSGSPSSAAASPSRCRIPSEYPFTRRPAASVELDQPEHFVDPRVGQVDGPAQGSQMVAPRAAGMEIGGFEHRADPQRRPLKLRVRHAEDERASARRLREAEQHAQRRRLPGAVRPEEARDRARFERERQVVDGEDLAEALRQGLANDDHPGEVIRGPSQWSAFIIVGKRVPAQRDACFPPKVGTTGQSHRKARVARMRRKSGCTRMKVAKHRVYAVLHVPRRRGLHDPTFGTARLLRARSSALHRRSSGGFRRHYCPGHHA